MPISGDSQFPEAPISSTSTSADPSSVITSAPPKDFRDLLDKLSELEGEAEEKPESDAEGDDVDDGEEGEAGAAVAGEEGKSGSGKKKNKKKKKSKAAKAVARLKEITTPSAPFPDALIQEIRHQMELEQGVSSSGASGSGTTNGNGSAGDVTGLSISGNGSVGKGGKKGVVDEDGKEVGDDDIRKALKAMNIMKILEGKQAIGNVQNTKDIGEHKFWKTQPVPQNLTNTISNLTSAASSSSSTSTSAARIEIEEGPIDTPKTVAEVRKEPIALPGGYEWVTVNVTDDVQLKEVATLLQENYVEDDDASFRLYYYAPFLRWALMPPGYVKEWHVGVRASSNKKLLAFISGIPVDVRVRKNSFRSAEINFLCAHKKLRSKRLAPVLIKEVTRRVNLRDIWQAVYTAGVVLPTPIGTCRYFHRNLNPPKLVDIGFHPIGRGETVAKLNRKFALPAQTTMAGFREMTKADVPQVAALLRTYMAKFELQQLFEPDAEVEHWFLSAVGKGPVRPGKQGREDQVVWAYVVEDPLTRLVTDFISFYSLASLIMADKKHDVLHTAYIYYYATDVAFTAASSDSDNSVRQKERLGSRLNELVHDVLIIAKQCGFDVMNALSLMDNNLFLNDQLFGQGNGFLNYYLYNWQCAPIDGSKSGFRTGETSAIGVVML